MQEMGLKVGKRGRTMSELTKTVLVNGAFTVVFVALASGAAAVLVIMLIEVLPDFKAWLRRRFRPGA